MLLTSMIEIMDRLDDLYDSDTVYQELIKMLVRYSFIEGHLPARDRRGFLINYYESVKLLSHFKKEPLFWLQYAIARLALKEYPEANQMFDVAYSFSKSRGYVENRHLDNQYARFFLESRTFSNSYSDYMDAFNRAHQILIRQMASENQSYNPYRVATNYFEFALRRKDQITPGDRLTIIKSCIEILRRISSSSFRLKSYTAVTHCEKKMKETMAILNS